MEYSGHPPVTPAPQTPYPRESEAPSSGGGGSSGGGRGQGRSRRGGRGASQPYADREKVTVKVSRDTQAWIKQHVADGKAKDQAEVVDKAIDLYKASLEGLAAGGGDEEEPSDEDAGGQPSARPRKRPKPDKYHPNKYATVGWDKVAPVFLCSVLQLKMLLDSIFKMGRGHIGCPQCGAPVNLRDDAVAQHNLSVRIRFQCSNPDCSWVNSWSSSPSPPEYRGPGDYLTRLVVHCALCCGLGFTQLRQFLSTIGLTTICWWRFSDVQRGGKGLARKWADAVMHVFEKRMAPVWEAIRKSTDPLVVVVDARFASSRNSYHGTSVFMEFETKKILLCESATKKMTGSSWLIEDHCIGTGIDKIEAKAGKPIAECIHDDKKSVDAKLSAKGIANSKDLWHVVRNLMAKKFVEEIAKSKRAKCQDLKSALCMAHLYDIKSDLLVDFLKEMKQPPRSGTKKDQLVAAVWDLLVQEKIVKAEDRDKDITPLAYPEVTKHDITGRLRGWMYKCARWASEYLLQAESPDEPPRKSIMPERSPAFAYILDLTVKRVINAANHYAGDHSMCQKLLGDKAKCCQQGRPVTAPFYAAGGPTHAAVKAFLIKNCTPQWFKCLILARENSHIETFNSCINKKAPKAYHFESTYDARCYVAAVDWNENIHRKPIKVYKRKTNVGTSTRTRPSTYRVLPKKTCTWVKEIWDAMHGIG